MELLSQKEKKKHYNIVKDLLLKHKLTPEKFYEHFNKHAKTPEKI